MLNKKGEVMILDFGLAAIATQLSGPEASNGTPAYMSPEQLKGTEVTAKSDIYSLGLVLYELFSGSRPYTAGTIPELIGLKVSIFMGGLAMFSFAGGAHIVPTADMAGMIFNLLSMGLSSGFICWLIYLAVEPSLRARWPHCIVTWNRILAGQWKDPQVWSHILVGGAAGLLLLLVEFGVDHFKLEVHGPWAVGWRDDLLGPRYWLANKFAIFWGCFQLALVLFLLMNGLRILLRREWIAALGIAVIFASRVALADTSSSRALTFFTFLIIIGFLMFVILRLGIVAFVAAQFFYDLSTVPLGLDWTTWYFPNAFASVCLILSISLWAFWRSMGTLFLFGYPDDTTR